MTNDMISKPIYNEFCELIDIYDGLIGDLCDAIDGPVDLEEILGYEPDWKGLADKEDKFKERLKKLMEE